jgi:hypothetical protein
MISQKMRPGVCDMDGSNIWDIQIKEFLSMDNMNKVRRVPKQRWVKP